MYQKKFCEIRTLVKYKMILRYIRENDESLNYDGMQRTGARSTGSGGQSAECGRSAERGMRAIAWSKRAEQNER